MEWLLLAIIIVLLAIIGTLRRKVKVLDAQLDVGAAKSDDIVAWLDCLNNHWVLLEYKHLLSEKTLTKNERFTLEKEREALVRTYHLRDQRRDYPGMDRPFDEWPQVLRDLYKEYDLRS